MDNLSRRADDAHFWNSETVALANLAAESPILLSRYSSLSFGMVGTASLEDVYKLLQRCKDLLPYGCGVVFEVLQGFWGQIFEGSNPSKSDFSYFAFI